MSSDDLLDRIERLLLRMLEKLERLESMLTAIAGGSEHTVALEVAMLSVIPAHRAVRIVREVVETLRRAGMDDPITRAIVEVLITHGEGVSISDLTRRVRELRGTASRRIVSERLKTLESRGVVTLKRTGTKVRVYLRRGVTDLEAGD